jgi:hypothetical protein
MTVQRRHERFVPGFQRGNFVDVIERSDWPE